jgi:hypothetical protein
MKYCQGKANSAKEMVLLSNPSEEIAALGGSSPGEPGAHRRTMVEGGGADGSENFRGRESGAWQGLDCTRNDSDIKLSYSVPG